MREVRLSRGAHDAPFDAEGNPTMCLMEMVSWLAREEFSDAPACASPVLTAFGRGLNDCSPEDERQTLRPLAVRLLGTAGDGQDERRVWMVRDWLIRRYAPAWLRLAGFAGYADRLADHAEILSEEDLEAVLPLLAAARSAARPAAWSPSWPAARSAARSAAESAARSAARSAAWPAAWSAAWPAAWSAAWPAARSAAESAARSAAESAAESAAWPAARSAARSAAWSAASPAAESAMTPTAERLRAEARELFAAIIDPGGIHDAPCAELLARGVEGLVATK